MVQQTEFKRFEDSVPSPQPLMAASYRPCLQTAEAAILGDFTLAQQGYCRTGQGASEESRTEDRDLLAESESESVRPRIYMR